MSLFATHTAWFDPSVPKEAVAEFTDNGGHITKSSTSANTQLLFSLTPPTQPSPSSSSPPLFFHPQWVSASVAAGQLQPLSAHLLPPAAYEANANAVELHLQVASRMGEEWRKGQLERGKGKKRGRGSRQQKKAKVLQDDEVDNEVMEVEPPKQTRRRGARSEAVAESVDNVQESETQAEEEEPKPKRSKRKQPANQLVANGDLSFQPWPETSRPFGNGRQSTATDEDAQKAQSAPTGSARSRRSSQQSEHNATANRKRTGYLVSKTRQPEPITGVSALGAFSSWFVDPFAPQPPTSPPQPQPQSAGTAAKAEEEDGAASDDEWEVEAVVDKRTSRRGQVEYRLKWSRADGKQVDEDDSYAWVKASDCHCDELVDRFERVRAAEQDVKDGTRKAKRAAAPSGSKQKRVEVKEQHVEEEKEDEIVDDDVGAGAGQSFGSWLVEPNFDTIIAELSTQRGGTRSTKTAAGRANRAQQNHAEEKGVKEEEQDEENEGKQPLHTSRARAAAARATSPFPTRPTRSAADRSRHAISDILDEFDKPLNIDNEQADDDDAAAAVGGEDEVSEVEIHEEKVEGHGDARTLTVRHTILRRSPARLTSLVPFPAVTSGRQLFFPRGKSPARVELHEEHKQQDHSEEKLGRVDEEDDEEMEGKVVDLDGELLPCELCGVGVRADKYEAHVRRCRGGTTAGRSRPTRTPR